MSVVSNMSGHHDQLHLWSGGELGEQNGTHGWKLVEERLRQKLGPQAYDKWFSRIVLERDEDNKVLLRVPNLMHQYWIEDNYLPLLQETLEGALGGTREITFQVAPELALNVPETELREAARSPKQESDEVPSEVVLGPLFKDESRFLKSCIEAGLNVRFSFDTFVVGPNSSYSSAVARAVAEKPGKTYNPLFLHGAVGLGKTHLMQAIGQEVMRNKPRKVIRYVTSEAFTNEYIEALRNHKVSEFRRKYRRVDVLLIDDIQFFAGKVSTQEEFFHTFNDLFNARKQIILSSDRAPSEIKNLESRLVSRFEWGMAAQIDTPDVETRTAILRQKLHDWSVQVEDWVLAFLAENIRTNVRRLEGALMRVAAHISLGNGEVLNRALLENLLKDILEEAESRAVTIDSIQKIVAEHFDIRLADMTSHRRPAAIAIPRQIAMYLAREMTSSSLKEIGAAFGGKDHGTVIHANKSVLAKMQQDDFRRTVAALTDKVRKFAQSPGA
jgi:chromosomal replication initiator protein